MTGLKNLFSPQTPKLPDPIRMPDPLDPAILEAKRAKMAQMQTRGGRQSTILTDGAGGSDNLAQSAGKIGA